MSPGRRGGEKPDREPDPATAAEVRAVRFRTTTFREGYEQDEVDDFLHEIVEEFEHPGETGLTAQRVVDKRFQATKFRAGYDQDEVDELLDRVVDALRLREEHPAPPGVPAHQADDVPAWGSEAAPAWGSEPGAPAWGTPESAAQLLATEVENTRFRTTSGLRTGYDITEVDGFLHLVVKTLRRSRPGPTSLTWREVAERTFFPTRFKPGYEPAEVDALLEKVARELRRRDGD